MAPRGRPSFRRSARRPVAAAAAVAAFLIAMGGLLRGQAEKAAKATSSRGGFVAAPVVYYSPETRQAWGIVGIH